MVLNFEGLRKAIQASQMSLALKKAIGLNKDTSDESLPESGASGSKEKDQEEIAFIRGIHLQLTFLRIKCTSPIFSK